MSSVVHGMGFVMPFPTILVIPSEIPSLTPIAARKKTFYLSALSWVLLVFVISGLAVLSSVLTISAAALDVSSTSLFLMLIVDLYSLSTLLVLLASPFIP